ncbi:MAG: hypothetical protein AB7W06_17370 [Alphaproteobacteria bacterium]
MRVGSLRIDFLGNLWLTPPAVRDHQGEVVDEPEPVDLGPMDAALDWVVPEWAVADFAELLDLWKHSDSTEDLRREWNAVYYSGLGDPSRF